MAIRLSVLGAFLFICIFNNVNGNGRLMEPRQRSSLWREGTYFKNSAVNRNYDDHTINCGGAWKIEAVGGKCGVCGDAWDLPEPRPNEAGGIYANGIIAKTYSTDNRFIDAEVEVTSSMSGYFKFNICPNNNFEQRVSEECLEEYPMKIFSTDGYAKGERYYPEMLAGEAGTVNLLLEIPEGLVCSQCVLRWKWHGGNSYGMCGTGWWAKGCGQQEEILNCADISILPNTITATETTTTEKYEPPTTYAPETTTTTTTTEAYTSKPPTTARLETTTTAAYKTTTTAAAETTTTAAPETTTIAAPETTTTTNAALKTTTTAAPETTTTAAPETTTTAAPETTTTAAPETTTTAAQETTTTAAQETTTTAAPETTTTAAPETTTTAVPETTTTAAPETTTIAAPETTTTTAAPETSTTVAPETTSTAAPETTTTAAPETTTTAVPETTTTAAPETTTTTAPETTTTAAPETTTTTAPETTTTTTAPETTTTASPERTTNSHDIHDDLKPFEPILDNTFVPDDNALPPSN